MSNSASDAFEQQLRDCLVHLYDYSYLQNHPLVRSLIPYAPGDGRRVQTFRDLIIQTIDSLKPTSEVDSLSKTARFYHILFLRYVKQHPVQHVAHDLNLGERQFFRDHNKAIHMLSQMLAEHNKGAQPAPDNAISIQSEIQRIHNQTHPEQIDAGGFLQKIVDALQGLTDLHHAHFQIKVSNQPLILVNDGAVLRQAILLILSQLVIQSAPDSQFALTFEILGDQGQFAFVRQGPEENARPLQFSSEQQETLNNLLQALGGQIDEASDADYHLSLTVPLRQHSVLIIDDNPDAIALFRSYLMNYPYQILTAYEAATALQLATESAPELIILDVMLPQQDGWEILQALKRHPQTLNIPVLICSVLDTAELAHGLGADGFLRKPPGEAEFLDVVTRFSRLDT